LLTEPSLRPYPGKLEIYLGAHWADVQRRRYRRALRPPQPWGPSDDFYLSFVMDAPSVLDVGCGTGRLLHRAREAGHTGRLCGVDPDVAALERARRSPRPGRRWSTVGGWSRGPLTGASDNIVTVARAA
jgi:SAM-dependent methyltransferase